MLRISTAALFVLWAHPHGPKVPDNVLLQLERTACFGSCPVYQVTVFKDGKILFEGKQNVKVKGRANGMLPAEKIEVLGQMLTDAHFFTQTDHVKRTVSDMPSIRIYAHWKDLVHEIHHYLGDSTAPASLKDFEGNLEQLLGTEHWVGTEK